MSPLVPLIVLFLGAGALLAGTSPRFQAAGLTAIAASAVAFLSLVMMIFWLPAGATLTATLSAWGPTSLLPLGLRLEANPLSWVFAVAAMAVTFATFLTGVARPGGRRLFVRGAILLLTAAALASIFAENLLTRVLAWAWLDLIYFLALLFLARGEGLEPQAVLNLAFNSTGTLLAVGAALMISRTSPGLSLRDAALSPQSTLLITLAVAFRLGLFPLHLGLPAELNIRQGLGTVLRLLPAAVALETLSRLSVFGFAEAARPWLIAFGLMAAFVGATQLWNLDEPRLGLTYVEITLSGLALLGGLWGGERALVTIAAQAVALILGGALIYLSQGYNEQDRWFNLPAFMGAATLVGAPLTIGFTAMNGLYAGAWAAGYGWLIPGVVLAHGVFMAGVLRAVFMPYEATPRSQTTLLAYFVGLGLLASLSVLFGLGSNLLARALNISSVGWLGFTGLTDTLVTFVCLGVACGGGAALWRFEGQLQVPTQRLGRFFTWLARIDWLYRVVWNLIGVSGRLMINIAAVVEGEGAMLWAFVALLLIWLLFR